MIDLVWTSIEDRHHMTLVKWISGKIFKNGARLRDCTTAMAIFENEELIAGVGYQGWDDDARTIELSVAAISPRWVQRKTLLEMYDYPFRQLNCQMVMARTTEKNKQLHRQMESLGHKGHRIERMLGPDEAEIIWTMTKEDWENGMRKKINKDSSDE